MQEQESDSLPTENDPVDVDTQIAESLVHQTLDGKKGIRLVYLSTTNMN